MFLVPSCSQTEIDVPQSKTSHYSGTPKAELRNSNGYYHNIVVAAVYDNGMEHMVSDGKITNNEMELLLNVCLSALARSGMDTTQARNEFRLIVKPEWLISSSVNVESTLMSTIDNYVINSKVSSEFQDSLKQMVVMFVDNNIHADDAKNWAEATFLSKRWTNNNDIEQAAITWDFLNNSHYFWTSVEGEQVLIPDLKESSSVIIVDTIIGVAFSPLGGIGGILLGGIASLMQNEGWY